MTQNESRLAEFRRQADAVKVLVSAARRRHEAGERLNLSELQARVDSICRMAGQPGPTDVSTRASLKSALEATVKDLNALSELVSASQKNLLRRITDAEREA